MHQEEQHVLNCLQVIQTRSELKKIGCYYRNSADSETQSLLKEMKATTNSIRMADSYLE